MKTNQKTLSYYAALARNGSANDVDTLMGDLHAGMALAQSKFIDFALGTIDSDIGASRISHYLFHGTQIQRNYATLYFARRDNWPLVRRAFDMGLIDAWQAFSR